MSAIPARASLNRNLSRHLDVFRMSRPRVGIATPRGPTTDQPERDDQVDRDVEVDDDRDDREEDPQGDQRNVTGQARGEPLGHHLDPFVAGVGSDQTFVHRVAPQD
jgi:hypothetical protein